jgi:hypothetical protein
MKASSSKKTTAAKGWKLPQLAPKKISFLEAQPSPDLVHVVSSAIAALMSDGPSMAVSNEARTDALARSAVAPRALASGEDSTPGAVRILGSGIKLPEGFVPGFASVPIEARRP